MWGVPVAGGMMHVCVCVVGGDDACVCVCGGG